MEISNVEKVKQKIQSLLLSFRKSDKRQQFKSENRSSFKIDNYNTETSKCSQKK